MSVCAECGQELEEGVVHVCASRRERVEAVPEYREPIGSGEPVRRGAGIEGFVDRAVLTGLLRQPAMSVQLQPERDVKYGWIGLAASVIGFFLWAWALQKELVNSIYSLFGGLGGFGTGSFGLGEIGQRFAFRFLLMGACSVMALVVTLWLLGNWRGVRSYSFKAIITYLGAMQLWAGAAYTAAAIVCFFSISLSFLIVVVVTLASLLLTVMQGFELYGVTAERRFTMTLLVIAGYGILFDIITKVIL